MNTVEKKRKRAYCYITCFVISFFMLLLLTFSVTLQWNKWVSVYTYAVIAILIYTTFSSNFDETLQSYIAITLSVASLFVYCFQSFDWNSTIIILCSLMVLTSIYMNVQLLLYLYVISAIMIGIQMCTPGMILLTSNIYIVEFIIKIIALISEGIFLIVFVHRLYETEQNLKESIEEARKAEHSKSDFLANMSHEIRTPMNAIVGMCELILREDINEEVRENCFNIQNSGRSLLSIINDILDFSKIESGKAELIEEEFNIGSTINDVINMANTRKGDKKIELIARIDPTIPKGLIGDEVRIKQIIVNLMTNAIKFTHQGCVTLKITQTCHDYGINLNVSVKDTGIGISEENLEKLFTSFQQVDTRKNRSVEGTGLGLAISKRLVTKMGGFINVESTYGEGSEFKFVIPLKVTDWTSFVHVKDADQKKVLVYLNMDKYPHPRIKRHYKKLIEEMSYKFGVSCTLYEERADFDQNVRSGDFTHCIIAKEEYCSDPEFFNTLADEIELLVIQDKNNAIDLPDNMKCIYKPFYALSVASVLNNEKYLVNLNQRSNSIIRFTAPDAKILIVDDNIINLKVAEGLMKPYRMRIVTVTGGREAITALDTKDYDIVFMDHMMPEMDGVEATKLIRAQRGEYYQNLPIIALTANAINGAREMFLKEGFNDFIAKPIELSVLDRMLKTWLPEKYIKSANIEDSVPNAKLHPTTGSQSFHAVINMEKGLIFAGNSLENYHEVLKVYYMNGLRYKDSLDNRYRNEDWTNYVIEAHALKSSSLSIGAEGLSELARTLELAGKEGNFEVIRLHHSDISNLYAAVLTELEKYLLENGCIGQEPENTAELLPENAASITRERLQELLDIIQNACENFDEEGIVAAAEELCSCSLNGILLKPFFAEVKKFAKDFEYEQAAKYAEKSAKEILQAQ